jgi:hypothetical protein
MTKSPVSRAKAVRGHPLPTEPPDWRCSHGAADRKQFEAWANARLDEWYEPASAADIRREQLLFSDPKFVAATEQYASRRLKHGRMIVAARSGDHEALTRLADTDELRQLGFRLALKRHRRGREKGDRRPGDLPELLKWCLEDAADDVNRIRKIWQEDYKRRNRTMDPTAVAIAARRHGVSETALINFRKNR